MFRSKVNVVGLAGLLVLSQSGCVSPETREEALRAATWPGPEPVIVSGLEQVWSVSLGSNRLARAVASDPVQGVIYVIASDFESRQWKLCVQISAGGKLQREFTYRKYATMLRTAQLRREASRDILMYGLWACDLVAREANGSPFWTRQHGIDDVWVADLDGDGLDEVIVGYNGSVGLHVLDGHGKLLWKNRQEGNVWHVCAADIDGNGKRKVISTSSRGKVRVFNPDGTRLPDLQPPPGYYADMVRPLKLSDSDRAEGLLVTGGNGRIAALKGDGTLAWEAQMEIPLAGGEAEPAPGKPWLAVRSGTLVILDTRHGSIIAEAKPGDYGDSRLCWLETHGRNSPLLIVCSRQRVFAYRVKE